MCFLPKPHCHSRSKTCATFTLCVFLGYSAHHKGYRCLDRSTNRVIISRHVFFDEGSFPFAEPSRPPREADFEFLDDITTNVPAPIGPSPLVSSTGSPPGAPALAHAAHGVPALPHAASGASTTPPAGAPAHSSRVGPPPGFPPRPVGTQAPAVTYGRSPASPAALTGSPPASGRPQPATPPTRQPQPAGPSLRPPAGPATLH